MTSSDDYKRLSFGGRGASDDIFSIFDPAVIEKHYKANKLLSVANDIGNTYIWILFAVGVPGNILSIVTALGMQPTVPTTFFVAVLAALDGVSIIIKFTAHQLVRNHHRIGTVGCKFQFLVVSTGTLASWILMLICSERFFSLYYPAKKKQIFTNRNCYIAVVILCVVFLGSFAGVSGAMRGADATGLRCGTYRDYLWFWVNVWYWINSALYLFVPCLCIIPMTIAMIRTLCRPNRREVSPVLKDTGTGNATVTIEEPSSRDDNMSDSGRGFTLTIIVIAILFLILSLPASLYFLSYRESHDVLVEAKWALFEQIQFVLADSRHSINFFFYFFLIQKFRTRLISPFLCKRFRETSLDHRQDVVAVTS